MLESFRHVAPGLSIALLAACNDPNRCDHHEDCGAEDLCWSGTCAPVTDRPWTIEAVSADVGWAHPDGQAWDVDHSPPDLYVEFGFPTDACVTTFVPDVYDPIWQQSCEFLVPRAPEFYADVWDVDGELDELAASYTWAGTPAFVDLARTAGTEVAFTDESQTVVVWLSLWPL